MPTSVGISFGSGLRRDVICTAFLMGLCSKGLGQVQIFGQCPHCQSMSLLNCKSRDCKWMYLQTHVLKSRLEMYFVVVLVLSHVQLLWPHGLYSEPGSPPWRKTWQPTLVFLLGKSHGWRNLGGHSPLDHRVGNSWVTENTHAHFISKFTILSIPGAKKKPNSYCPVFNARCQLECSYYHQAYKTMSMISLEYRRAVVTGWSSPFL